MNRKPGMIPPEVMQWVIIGASVVAGLAIFAALNVIAIVAIAVAAAGYLLTDGDDDLP